LSNNLLMTKLKVRAIGSSYGVILPKEILDALNVAEGDELFAIRTPEGLKLTPYNPDFEKWLDAANDAVRRYRNDLRALAKS
jgi:putative addiction module antidote